jgi:hypothetical protein
MNARQLTETFTNTAVPLIGRCPKCRTEIFASHPYAWCVRCSERLPYRMNMSRRPIMYEKSGIWPFEMDSESKDN